MAAFFPSASHSTFEGLQFNVTQTIQALDANPLAILHKYRALEATYTSKTAASATKCKPGTRIKAIKDITSWGIEVVGLSLSSESMLWLRGPAGAGKTCIMREVTRVCRERGILAGDYFFSTQVPGLDDETPFIATIVSHLITAIPALEHLIQETIRSNPTIFSQSLDVQVEELISNHIASLPPQNPAPRIIVVDGFDECRNQKQRAHLLRLLRSLVSPPHSFRVIMASRPEYDIRTAFSQPPLSSITRTLRLEDYEASGEIYQYLCDEFNKIRETHPAKESIPLQWPGEATLHALTDKSSGGYIYPSVVIKYVDNPRRHPVDLLEHVLKPTSTATSGRPFAELDALYEIVLSPPDTDIPLMKRLLHFIIEITQLPPALRRICHTAEKLTHEILLASHFDEFLSLRKGTTKMTFCDLHSVLSVNEAKCRWIYFHHKSLADYLCSPQRAGSLYQPQTHTLSDLLTSAIHNMELWNVRLTGPDPGFWNVEPTLLYSCQIWKHLLIGQKCLPSSVLDSDSRIVWRCFAFARVYPPHKSILSDFIDNFHHEMVCLIGLIKFWH
ncbi:hypothetical protein MD484_g5677, partial [Candolleomyces efflorescens]